MPRLSGTVAESHLLETATQYPIRFLFLVTYLIDTQLSRVEYPSQAIPGVKGHLHTPGHHSDTQGLGAPDLSDGQGVAPALIFPWASSFLLNKSALTINRQSVRGMLWLRSDVSLIPYFYHRIHECGKKFV